MSRTRACVFLLLAAALLAAAPASAQVQTADHSKPITVKEAKPKPVKFIGEVVSSNTQSITVRSRDEQPVIRTFSYSREIQEKMLRILERGGYQFGDKVEITSQPGSDIALDVKGKPSKPL